jgi:two-component system, OmpR family, sensor kinase
VFSNLLSNAIKYSPSGGVIEIGAEVSTSEVIVVVVDHGIGIPQGDLNRLFERYHRGSNVSGIVGTGVGLHLVKMVVELHDGRIVVDSKEGAGSRFAIHLPIKDASSVKMWPPVKLEATALGMAAGGRTKPAQRLH